MGRSFVRDSFCLSACVAACRCGKVFVSRTAVPFRTGLGDMRGGCVAAAAFGRLSACRMRGHADCSAAGRYLRTPDLLGGPYRTGRAFARIGRCLGQVRTGCTACIHRRRSGFTAGSSPVSCVMRNPYLPVRFPVDRSRSEACGGARLGVGCDYGSTTSVRPSAETLCPARR